MHPDRTDSLPFNQSRASESCAACQPHTIFERSFRSSFNGCEQTASERSFLSRRRIVLSRTFRPWGIAINQAPLRAALKIQIPPLLSQSLGPRLAISRTTNRRITQRGTSSRLNGPIAKRRRTLEPGR